MSTAGQLRAAGCYVPPHIQDHEDFLPHQIAGHYPIGITANPLEPDQLVYVKDGNFSWVPIKQKP